MGSGRRLHRVQQSPHLSPHGEQRIPGGGAEDPGPPGETGTGGQDGLLGWQKVMT